MAKKKDDGESFEKLLTDSELAKETGLTVPFIRKARAEYGFPFYKIGHNVRFRLSEVNVWLKQRHKAG